jgi:hypothetical protein
MSGDFRRIYFSLRRSNNEMWILINTSMFPYTSEDYTQPCMGCLIHNNFMIRELELEVKLMISEHLKGLSKIYF